MFTRRSSSSCDGNLSSREGLTQSQRWNSLPWKSSEIRADGKSPVEGGKEATPGKGSAGQGRRPEEAPSTGGTGWTWARAEPAEARWESETRDAAGEAETGPFQVSWDPVKESNSDQNPSEMFPHRGQKIRHTLRKKPRWLLWGGIKKEKVED